MRFVGFLGFPRLGARFVFGTPDFVMGFGLLSNNCVFWFDLPVDRKIGNSISDIYGFLTISKHTLSPHWIKNMKALCLERYRRKDEEEHKQCSEVESEREEECGICMEMKSKIVLPNCNHAMCLKCYREWRLRSQSCPFCRDSLKRVNSCDLWVFLDGRDVLDISAITRENLKRLFMYIDKLPLVVPETLFDAYDTHLSSFFKDMKDYSLSLALEGVGKYLPGFVSFSPL
ncbi:RING/U-box superfamily protein [Striga asiatica]|uniref:RING/U-box superfamily protein n=1 Tax=Striga asiatica TaxID=4170 RepID=A0A5A7R9N1_STRAF|nr:RING/U-box superfamily protein [Striga asiatica]